MEDSKYKRKIEKTDETSMPPKKLKLDDETISDSRKSKKTGENKSKICTITDKERNKNKFEFFYGKTSPFSQFHSADLTVNDVKYNCAEQFMMHSKAVLFKDDSIAKQILKTTKPLQQKRLGRKVKNFDQKVWGGKCQAIVEEGNEAKFSQNKDLKDALYATYPKILVEASPRDRLWGIGLGKDNPLAWDEKTWRGKNLLGYALTKVRNRMMENDGLLDNIVH